MLLSVVRTEKDTSEETKSFTKVQKRCNVMEDLDIFTKWISQSDVCRCCLFTSGSFNVTDCFATEDGRTEIYADMLFECYGIKLSHLVESGPSRMMCQSCVHQLKSACTFKKQVMIAEKHFNDYFNKIDNTDMLKEELFETHDRSGDGMCYDETYQNEEDEDDQKHDVDPLQVTDKDTIPTKTKRLTDNLDIQPKEPKIGVKEVDFESNIPLTKMVKIKANASNLTTEKKLIKVKKVKPVNITVGSKFKELNNIEKNLRGSMINAVKVTAGDKSKEAKNTEEVGGPGNVYNVGKKMINIRGVKSIGDVGDLSNATKFISGRKIDRNISVGAKLLAAKQLARLKEMEVNAGKTIEDTETSVNKEFQGTGTHNGRNEKGPDRKSELVESRIYNANIRSNIALILKNSTIIPFRYMHKRDFVCLYCDVKSFFYADLKKHVEDAHSNIKKKCIKRRIRTPRDLVKVDISDIRCKLCMQSYSVRDVGEEMFCNLLDREGKNNFETIESLVDHLVMFHKKSYKHISSVIPSHYLLGFYMSTDKMSCHICKKTFHSFLDLIIHTNGHFNTFVCHICGKTMLSKSRLDTHMSCTHRAKKLTFRMENKGPNAKNGKTDNLKLEHSSNKKVICVLCQESFTRYVDKLKHMYAKHNVKIPEFKCEICFKRLSQKVSLKNHIRFVHMGESNFICDNCGKSFKTKMAIRHHMTLHTGVKTYECTYCDKRFRLRNTWKVHVRGHLNVKPYACTLCDAAFIQKHCLTSHMRVHHPNG